MRPEGACFWFIFLFNSLTSISQPHNFAFKTININDGLSQNSVVDIVEDDKGFMWFATQDGLNRYDGRHFLVFPVSYDDITTPDMAQLGKLVAKKNEILMIKKGGKIESFNLLTQKFSPFQFRGLGNGIPPVASSIFIDKGEGLWIGTMQNGVFHYTKDKNLQRFSTNSPMQERILSNRIQSIFEDSTGQIWVLSNKGATVLMAKTTENHLQGINTNVLVEGPKKTFWLGTLGKGIFLKKGETRFQPFLGYKNQSISQDLVVETMLIDDQKRIWVGTYGNGLYIIDPSKETIDHLLPDRNDPFSLGFQDVLSLIKDRNGGIWVGTDGGGISYYNILFNSFSSIGVHNVDTNISIEQIRSIVKDDDGMVWFGTSGQGLTSFDPNDNSFKTFHLEPYKPGVSNYDRIISLQIDEDGDLWIGTQGNGLLIFDRKTEKMKKWFTTDAIEIKNKIPDNTIWSILPEKDGQMWIATRNAGLVLMDKEKGEIQHFELDQIDSRKSKGFNVESMLRINHFTLVVSFEPGNIYLFNIPSGKFTALGNKKVKAYIGEETTIKSMFYEEGWLWLGTAGKGVIITNLKTHKTYLVDDKNWLPNNMIYSILQEQNGMLWMSSNKGLFRLSYKMTPEELSITQIHSFLVADGLQSNEFNTGAYFHSSEGEFFFGGISGLTYFNPSVIPYNSGNNAVVLTDALIGNDRLAGDTVITYKNQLMLTHRQNSLSFNYTVLDFISPENLSFQYKLEGYDDDWIDAGVRNYTAYTNLPPNDYVFNVKVSDKIAEEAPVTSLFISIAVPFWQQWWFILLVALLAFSIIYSLHRYRIYQLLQVEKVKNTISADLHDDLGSRLTNIQMLSAISKLKIGSDREEIKYLQGIEEEVEASAKALDEIVWNIKMKDESLEEVVAKMRIYAEEVLAQEYAYTIDIEGKFRKKKMSMQKRRELFLVFKELLNNIKKHAHATKVVIKITIEDGMFLLAVQDNGRGFDPQASTHRNGLRNIKQRVKRWNGSLRLRSNENKGTAVALKIPFDHSWFAV